MKKCPLCDKPLEKVVTEISCFNNSIKVNPVKALKCTGCGEEFIDEKENERVYQKIHSLREVEKKEKIKSIRAII